MQSILGAKILTEIQKLMFNRAHFARFLQANAFDQAKALEHFKEYLQWRKNSKIDHLMELEFQQYDSIKEFLPSGFFEVDKDVLFKLMYRADPFSCWR